MEDEQEIIPTEASSASTHTTSKFVNTFVACVGASLLTYPAEKYHSDWKSGILSKWANLRHDSINVPVRSRFRLIIGPIARLQLHEILATSLMSQSEIFHRNSTYKELIAGASAGVIQALLLCPVDTYRALERHTAETESSKSWLRYLRQQLMEGGSMDPKERLFRAYRGVGLLAIREVMYNISFFPLFSWLRHSLPQYIGSGHEFSKSSVTTVTAGLLAGVTCSVVVVPIEILRLHFWYSGSRFSVFSGKKKIALPWESMLRGWTIHAATIFGPTFGLVAAIYELA